eukprot:12877654-Alexandrium_andersonii.AAC.1
MSLALAALVCLRAFCSSARARPTAPLSRTCRRKPPWRWIARRRTRATATRRAAIVPWSVALA